nr:hypothetical protein [Kitasatospora cheerisanensis]
MGSRIAANPTSAVGATIARYSGTGTCGTGEPVRPRLTVASGSSGTAVPAATATATAIPASTRTIRSTCRGGAPTSRSSANSRARPRVARTSVLATAIARYPKTRASGSALVSTDAPAWARWAADRPPRSSTSSPG